MSSDLSRAIATERMPLPISGWRDHLSGHPALSLLHCVAPDRDEEIERLWADIEQHGLAQPIAAARLNGALTLLDGWRRADAIERYGHREIFGGKGGLRNLKELGLRLRNPAQRELVMVIAVADPAAYVWSVNAERRHLTRAAKWALVAEWLKRWPETSDRAIGRVVQLSPSKVGDVRRATVPVSEIQLGRCRRRHDGKIYPVNRGVQIGHLDVGQVRVVPISAVEALEATTPITELYRLDKKRLRQLQAEVQARKRLLDDPAWHLRRLTDGH